MLKAIEILKTAMYDCDSENEKIVIDFEYTIKDIKNAIQELEEIENRSCENCKYDHCGCDIQDILYNFDSNSDLSKFCCNIYEKKEIKCI